MLSIPVPAVKSSVTQIYCGENVYNPNPNPTTFNDPGYLLLSEELQIDQNMANFSNACAVKVAPSRVMSPH